VGVPAGLHHRHARGTGEAGGVVGAVVSDDNHGVGLVGLAAKRGERAGKAAALVVGGDDHHGAAYSIGPVAVADPRRFGKGTHNAAQCGLERRSGPYLRCDRPGDGSGCGCGRARMFGLALR